MWNCIIEGKIGEPEIARYDTGTTVGINSYNVYLNLNIIDAKTLKGALKIPYCCSFALNLFHRYF